MKVIFSAESRQDLQGIFEYIADDNLDAAINFVRRLRQRCLDVAPMRNVGRKRDDIRRGYRSVIEGVRDHLSGERRWCRDFACGAWEVRHFKDCLS